MNTAKKNTVLFYLQQVSFTLTQLIAFGTIFCTFMLESGISETEVSICTTVFQVVQTATMILISRLAENKKIVLKGIGVCCFSYALVIAAMLFLSVRSNSPVSTSYVLLFTVGTVVSLFAGLYNVLSYKQPHLIMDIKNYGKIIGQIGVISGILGIALSSTMSFLCENYDYFNVMTFVCIFGIILAVVSGLISFFFIPTDSENVTKSEKSIKIFRYKPFYQLFVPNLLRGFSTGIFNLIAVIGYYCEILDSAGAVALVTASQIATLLSSQCFSFISQRNKNGILCLVSSIVCLVCFPAITAGGSKTMFIVFYFIAYLFFNFINNAIPVVVALHIDYNCLGQFTAWRMGIYTLGTAIGGACVPILLKWFGSFNTLLIAGITMLVCGVGYYIFDKKATAEKI